MRDRLEQKWTLLEPQYCGLKKDDAGNQIWWPDENEKTKEADIAVIGKDLDRPLVPWLARESPEIWLEKKSLLCRVFLLF